MKELFTSLVSPNEQLWMSIVIGVGLVYGIMRVIFNSKNKG